jgi:hypothetical protein
MHTCRSHFSNEINGKRTERNIDNKIVCNMFLNTSPADLGDCLW